MENNDEVIQSKNYKNISADFRRRPDVSNDRGLRRRRWGERSQFTLQGDPHNYYDGYDGYDDDDNAGDDDDDV